MRRSLFELSFFFGFLALCAFVANIIVFSPCDSPVTYKIQSVDPRFNLSRNDFLQDVEQGAQIWNTAEGKTILQYDQSGNVAVSLVFDQRQELSNQINSLQGQLDNQKGTIDEQIAKYQKDRAAFEQKVSDLNSQIQYWNSKGGAPPDEYNKLVDQQRQLQAQASALNATAKILNQSTVSYNSQVNTLDQTIDSFNQQLSNKPEEGLYNPNDKTVTVYFNNTQNELVHTIAHELGHALGLNHNNNQASIMYAFTNKSLIPTRDDLDALSTVCAKRSYWSVFEDRVNAIYKILQQKYFQQVQQ